VEDVLLIAADRQFRRLVYAQLLEEGFSVLALPALANALAHLLRGGEPSRLTILDLQDQEVTAGQIADLWQLTGQAPLIVCAGVVDQALLHQMGLPPARVLLRPFSVGDVIDGVWRMRPWPANGVS
jgi:hypothetical protein